LPNAADSGSREVLAYTSLYYHEQIRRFNGVKDTIDPVGFYIVVWNDGTVEKMPYDQVLYVKDPQTGRMYKGFTGQAGTANAETFDQHYAGVMREAKH
jgi:hypothetical protein